eukprot:scaffold45613_cov33-Phaeocystis_antarctica.AAC.1
MRIPGCNRIYPRPHLRAGGHRAVAAHAQHLAYDGRRAATQTPRARDLAAPAHRRVQRRGPRRLTEAA